MAPLSLFFVAFAVSAHAYDVRRVAPPTSGAVEMETIPSAQFYVSLTEKVSRPAYKKNMLKALGRSTASNYTGDLAGSVNDSEYLTDITIGGQTFKVIVDTGSWVCNWVVLYDTPELILLSRSDTWLAKKGFKCYNLTR